MSDLSGRTWIFLVGAAVLDVLTVKGVAPVGAVAVVAVALAVGLRVEWFLPALAAGWALVSIPVLAALGASGATRDRLAILFLALMAAALGRLIAAVRGTVDEEGTGGRTKVDSRTGQEGERWAW